MARNRRRRRDEKAGEGLEGTPAPDPLDHSSAYVDEAKMAEAGIEPVDARGHVDPEDAWDAGEDFERAPDQLERDDATAPVGMPVAGLPGTPTRKQRGRVLTFLGHCADELRRVQWPNRRQVGQGTAVTLGFVVLAGGFLGLMDAIWKPIVERII